MPGRAVHVEGTDEDVWLAHAQPPGYYSDQ